MFYRYFIYVISFVLITANSCTQKSGKCSNYNTFVFENELRLPGVPEYIYDKITGDISPWWDHSFSENPYKFYIDPKPGGGFYELFDSLGNGAKHAEVIFAKRGEILRFQGPLGLSGQAIKFVVTYNFETIGIDSTLLKLEVHAAGEIEDRIPEIVLMLHQVEAQYLVCVCQLGFLSLMIVRKLRSQEGLMLLQEVFFSYQ